MSRSTLRRYLDTARHLRPAQVFGRLWFRAVRPRPRPSPAPPLRVVSSPWVQPIERRASLLDKEVFCFLGETRSLAAGWDDPQASKLWRYNLHYFDDLNAARAVERSAWHSQLLLRWILQNPLNLDGTGWEPYPTSLRIVNWIKWARAGNLLPPEVIDSLALQVRWLIHRLEYHLLGNHLFANAKALVFAGTFFDGPEAQGWLQRGHAILRRQLPEQVLNDGGHFELSPMYHALVLEDLFDLINACRCAGLAVPATWHDAVDRMRNWLSSMSHPDGEIAFFNDAAFGISPRTAEIEQYARRLGCAGLPASRGGLGHLDDSGYIRLADGDAVALLDVARIGPDYLPGHAHADTLSFELSVHGRRCLVNSGTSVYGLGPERLRQRGTPAHNTVAVDGQDSSEVWSGFRVARRARPVGLALRKSTSGWQVSCAHDGYRWLSGRPRHRRTWQFGNCELMITDEVSEAAASSVSAFHFHPDLTLSVEAGADKGELTNCGETVMRWRVTKGRARVETATWHPEFGVSLATHKLLVELVGGGSEVTFSWS